MEDPFAFLIHHKLKYGKIFDLIALLKRVPIQVLVWILKNRSVTLDYTLFKLIDQQSVIILNIFINTHKSCNSFIRSNQVSQFYF